MINFNGNVVSEATVSLQNRALNYGDALFETCKVVNGKILFWEDHYFRLMASMRMLRMEIPMVFTMEFLEAEIIKLLQTQNETAFRIKLLVFRNDGGFFEPKTHQVSYFITAQALTEATFEPKTNYTVDLFKDYYTNTSLINTLKTTNKLVNVLASIYAKENTLDTCLLINDNKNITEAIAANLFLLKDNIIKTPPLTSGCLKGVMRKQLINLINSDKSLVLVEEDISPFDLQKADELFLTNSIIGIQPITKYRKKVFETTVSSKLLKLLNSSLDH